MKRAEIQATIRLGMAEKSAKIIFEVQDDTTLEEIEREAWEEVL